MGTFPSSLKPSNLAPSTPIRSSFLRRASFGFGPSTESLRGVSFGHAHFVLTALALACLVFIGGRAISTGVPGWANQAVRLFNLVALLLVSGGLVRWPKTFSPERSVLLATSISLACAGTVCALENDATNTAVAAIAVTLAMASFVPWPTRYQIILVLVATASVVGNHLWLGAHAQATEITTLISAVLTFGATVFIARTLETTREKTRAEEQRRRRAEDELRLANEALEERVHTRTAEVREAVAELHAFTYSVSHDLRSPLRAINGMTQIIEDELAGRLKGTEVVHLAKVKQASQRMDQLIDALLGRSRVGQAVLHRESIDLSVLADTAIADLRRATPERCVQWVRPRNVTVLADRTLAAVVLQHLLDNAWKFTRTSPHPRIEFGNRARGNQTEYFVSDNGTGFLMEHAGKLFENFQRLHGDEYEGTGIGLATVRGIVARHGGQVRIESAPGEGTTVYFTLGDSASAASDAGSAPRANAA